MSSLQCVSLRNWKILKKNGSISSRVLYSVIHRSPRATRSARPCGTMDGRKRYADVGMNTQRGLAGPWFPNVNLYLYTEKGRKKEVSIARAVMTGRRNCDKGVLTRMAALRLGFVISKALVCRTRKTIFRSASPFFRIINFRCVLALLNIFCGLSIRKGRFC